jgi:tRNA-binding protein
LKSPYNSFKNLDIRVGTILSANDFKDAINPSYKLKIDFGTLGVLKSSAQITELYKIDNLIGTQVIAIVNFPKKQIANFMSECLVLGIVKNEKVVLLRPDSKVDNGLKVL